MSTIWRSHAFLKFEVIFELKIESRNEYVCLYVGMFFEYSSMYCAKVNK